MSEMNEDRPDLSTSPFNFFEVNEAFKFNDPLSIAMSQWSDGENYGRVDLNTPMGCNFSIFIIRGFPESDEEGSLSPKVCSLTIYRELAGSLAGQLSEAQVTEVRYDAESGIFESREMELVRTAEKGEAV